MVGLVPTIHDFFRPRSVSPPPKKTWMLGTSPRLSGTFFADHVGIHWNSI
jgi:hypothetical protein